MLSVSVVLCALLAVSPDGGVEDEAPDAGVEDVADAGEAPEVELPPLEAWWTGDHLSGEWGGARTWLADHGITFDIIYAGEVFANAAARDPGENGGYTGHFDLALTLDTKGLGLWPGGKVYLLAQENHGRGINEFVGSVTEISNIEAKPYTQLGEFFIEQNFFDKVVIRLGKQDANREFGTPRFGGNFINNNFGMLPSMPLPSYPNNGLAAVMTVTPVWWLTLKAAVFEGRSQVSSWGFDSALAPNAGHFLVGGINLKHDFWPGERVNGSFSAGFYRQQGVFEEITDRPQPQTFDQSWGLYVQHDERIFLNPLDKEDPRCFTVIGRFGWSQADRNLMPFFFSVSVAYHGIGTRQDDTVGIGFGGFAVTRQAGGTPGTGHEGFIELFYKWRMSKFMSLQPSVQYIRSPGGDLPDALLAGMRLKFKI